MTGQIQRVAILGLGALGASYAKQICEHAPQMTLYGVIRELEAYWGSPILINDQPLRINYRTIDSLRGIPLDLILVCVKSYSATEAIAAIKELAGPDTIILPLVSGLASEQVFVQAFGRGQVLPSVVLHTDIHRNDRYITLGDLGMICCGSADGSLEVKAQLVKAFFDKCQIKCLVTKRIDYFKWQQLLLSVGYGQTSTVFQLTCGAFRSNEKAMEVMDAAQRELMLLANACGVAMYDSDLRPAQEALKRLAGDSRAPMLQDYWVGRRLETDVLCDAVCRLGAEKGVAIPANLWLQEQLHAMVQKRTEIPIDDTAVKGLSVRQGYLATPEKIANQLRVDIIKSKYATGDKISEKDLAQQFDVSRSSVRSALQMLASEGLLQTLPNGRRKVAGFGPRQLQDLYDIRWLMENQALELLFEKRQTVYPKLVQVLGVIEQKYRYKSTDTHWHDLDVLFHKNLVASADNLFLSNAWESSIQVWYALMSFQHPANQGGHYDGEFFCKHRHLYELILSGDRAAFPELKRHIQEDKESADLILRSITPPGASEIHSS